jgi:DNA-directed RNA polymerase specialized sigma24 family protein
LGREHDAFVEAIIAAAVLGCSNREIAEQAGVSFQRVSKVVRTHRLPPP